MSSGAPCCSGRGQPRQPIVGSRGGTRPARPVASSRGCRDASGSRSAGRNGSRAWTVAAAAIEASSAAASRAGRAAAIAEYDAMLQAARPGLVLGGDGDDGAAAQVGADGDEELTPRRIMNRKLKCCATVVELLGLIDAEAAHFDAVNLSHAFSRLAKLHRGAFGPDGAATAGAAAAAEEEPSSSTSSSAAAPAANDAHLFRGTPLHHHRQQQHHHQQHQQEQHTGVRTHDARRQPRVGRPDAEHEQRLGYVLASLAAQLPRVASDFDSRDVSTCLWALSALPRAVSRAHAGTFEVLCRRGRQVAVLMNPADCAMYMQAFGMLGTYDTELLHAIPQVMLQELDRTDMQNVRTVLWGFAHLGPDHPQAPSAMFMEAVCDHLMWSMEQCSNQELTNCLWAIAKLGHRPSLGLLRAAEARLLAAQEQLRPIDVAHALWAFGRLRFRAARLMSELPPLLAGELEAYAPEELSCVLFGYTHARHYSPRLLDAAAPLLAARAAAGQLSQQDVVIALWTYGIFGHRPGGAGGGRGEDDGWDGGAAVHECGGEAGESDCAASAGSSDCSGGGGGGAPGSEDVVDALLDALLARGGVFGLAQLPTVALANVVKALASVRRPGCSARTAALAAAVAGAAERRVEDFSPCEMSNVLYGLALLRYTEPAPYSAAVRELLKRLDAAADEHGITHRMLNSIVHSCVSVGYTPWTLIEAAEMRGLRLHGNPAGLKPRWLSPPRAAPQPGPRPERVHMRRVPLFIRATGVVEHTEEHMDGHMEQHTEERYCMQAAGVQEHGAAQHAQQGWHASLPSACGAHSMHAAGGAGVTLLEHLAAPASSEQVIRGR